MLKTRRSRIGPIVVVLFTAASVACHTDRDHADRETLTNTEGQRLQFIATPLRNKFPTHSPLLVEIEIRNESDSAVVFHPAFVMGGQALAAEIVDSEGQPVELTAQIFDPYFPPTTLEKGHVLRDTLDLRCDMGVFGAPPEACGVPYDGLFIQGTYTVTLHFYLPCVSCTKYPHLETQPFVIQVAGPD